MDTGRNESSVTVGNWMLTFLLMCIPLVNLIMLFVWAFGGNVELSKSTPEFARDHIAELVFDRV